MYWKIYGGLLLAFMLWFPAVLSAQKKGTAAEITRDTTLANTYLAAADKYYKETKFDSSIVWYQKAGPLYQEHGAWKPYVKCLDFISVCYRMKAQYGAALAYCDSFARVSTALWGAEDPEVANAFSSTGVVYQLMGEYDRSMEFHFKALAIREKKLGGRHISTAISYANLAILYYYKGFYDESLKFNYKALDIRLAAQGPRHMNVGSSYINLGVVYRVMGDNDKAEEMYLNALDIMKQALGEKHPRVATVYSNLGIVYDLKGDVEKSLAFYKKAAAIRLETLGPDHPDLANTYNDMGILFSNQEDFDQALYYYDQSFRIRQKNFKGDNPFLAMSHGNLGSVYKEKKMFGPALEQFGLALAMNRAIYGERHVDVASGYQLIGETYFAMNRYDSAAFFYGRAMEIVRDIYGEHHPLVAHTYRAMARVAERQGRREEALSLAQRALMSVVPELTDSSYTADPVLSDSLSGMDLFESLSCKAHLLETYFLQTQNKEVLERSLAGYELIAEWIERMRFGYRADGSKLFLGKKAKKEYENAIRVCYRLYQLTGELIYAEKAFEFSEKSKAGVLLEAMFDADARKFAGIPDSLLAKEKDIRLKLSFYETQIEKEAGNKRKDTVKIMEYENRLFFVRAEYDDLIRSLENDYPGYFRLKYRSHPVTMAAVREQLGKDATLVEYFSGDSALFIITLNASQFAFRSFPKDAAFDSVVTGVRRSVVDLDFKSYPNAAYRAYRWLIAPVTQELKPGGRIIIIPDGILNYLPFDMLLTKEVNFLKGIDFTQLPYLIRNFTISYSYSAGLITSRDKKAEGGFLGFAPVFSDSANTGYIKSVILDTTTRDVTLQGSRFAELPYTEKEVNEILRSFEKHRRTGQIYVKDQAGEQNFKSAAAEKFRFIHVASHGFIHESNPKLSGIIFSQNDSASSEDGVLYAGEIYGLKLDAELVTLSACKSGWGKVVKGEGIMGLTRGFIYSGAKNVLVSLWQLGDESASELMIRFYEYVLAGDDLSAALRKAKLDFIRDKKYSYPADWGGFVLIGR